MRIFQLPRGVQISVILNIITFLIYIFSGAQESSGLISGKNLFVASIILTVINLFIVNIATSWKTGKEFYLKKQYFLLFGQIAIAALIVTIAAAITIFLIKNFISY